MALIQKKNIELKVNDKTRKFWFGMGALGLFLDDVKSKGVTLNNMTDALSENPFYYVPKLMFHCYAYGFIRQGAKPDITEFIVAEWIDENGGIGGELFTQFLNAFTASLEAGVPEEKVDDLERIDKAKTKAKGKPKA